jgi:hypothetical protein
MSETGTGPAFDPVEVAHDINNLLVPIRAYGALALTTLERGGDPSDTLRRLLDATERAASLTGRLAAAGRPPALPAA